MIRLLMVLVALLGTQPAVGAILPTGVDAPALDATLRAYHAAWRATYLRFACGDGRAYVWLGSEPDTPAGRIVTVSEGQAYGMLIAVLMPEPDRDGFDALLRFVRDHPSRHDPALPAWRQRDDCATTDDPNSAADADILIAEALLLADARWGSGGAIDYRGEALRMIEAMSRLERHPQTDLPQLGAGILPEQVDAYDAVRPSDLMPVSFRAFAEATGDARWNGAVDAGYALLDRLQREYAPKTGLVADFVVATATAPRPAPPDFFGQVDPHVYGWNACRVPWVLGLDVMLHGDRRALAVLDRLQDWAVATSGGDPLRLMAGYRLDGTPLVSFTSPAFLAPLAVAAAADPRRQAWLDALWPMISATEVTQVTDYYGNTLRLLAMLAIGGYWRTP